MQREISATGSVAIAPPAPAASLSNARADADETKRVRERLAGIGFPDRAHVEDVLASACRSKELRNLVGAKIALANK